jgi:hypothetical protein
MIGKEGAPLVERLMLVAMFTAQAAKLQHEQQSPGCTRDQFRSQPGKIV